MEAYPMPGPAQYWADFGILGVRIKTAQEGASHTNLSLTDSPYVEGERLMAKYKSSPLSVNNGASPKPSRRKHGPHSTRPRPVEVTCQTCGTVFLKHLCKIKRNPRHFCSRDCYWRSLNGHVQSDETRQKRSKALSDEKSPTWKGGQSRQYKRGYKSEHFKHWRKAVFERDNYTCQDCGQHGGYLTAHHIQSFAQVPHLRYEVGNGVTLCEPCHAERDNYYARFHPSVKRGG